MYFKVYYGFGMENRFFAVFADSRETALNFITRLGYEVEAIEEITSEEYWESIGEARAE